MFNKSMLGAAVLLLGACQQGATPGASPQAAADAIAPILATPDAVDTQSFAKPLEARVSHVALDLGVDFAARQLAGTATLDIQAKPGVSTVILDDRGLEIESIADADGKPLPFKVGVAVPDKGAPLEVTMGAARKLVIKYASAKDASALQWMTPEQTSGKKYPFLFSQGESTNNRTWIPTQDSPGIRQSWEARIHVDKPLTAVMSAPKAGEALDDGNRRTFSYKMDHPVAPYLIAIAVGDLAFRDLGPRTGVWSEPSMLNAAAHELEDTEKMVTAAETLYGPYRWGRYDVIVLPPSFPIGGMENPNLTFLTPTFLAGDKSLVSLVAHELAHSWSGNLATNATWGDLWLNEGLTTYAEGRIVESLYGPKAAAEHNALSIDDLNTAIEEKGGASNPDTSLYLDLKGRNPDDVSSNVAYEKGAAFGRMLEKNVGREALDAYMRGWFDRHAFQPVTSSLFVADLRKYLVKGDAALEAKLMIDQWVYGPGVPANAVPADPTAFADANRASDAFAGGAAPDPAAWAGFNSDERLRFLNRLPRMLPTERLDALEQAFKLNETRNNEVLFAWLDLATRNRYDPAAPALEKFLTTLGRGKFVKPLYKTLYADPLWGRPIAQRIFARAQSFYHPLVGTAVAKIMSGKS